MDILNEKYFALQTLIQIEEFKFWDAERNGCSPLILSGIERNIKSLKAHVIVLQLISPQNALS